VVLVVCIFRDDDGTETPVSSSLGDFAFATVSDRTGTPTIVDGRRWCVLSGAHS